MRAIDSDSKDRRKFLKASAMGAMAGSALVATANAFSIGTVQDKQVAKKSRHRIQKMSLLSPAPLAKMAEYYKSVLEMNVQLSEKDLVVEAGGTQITFTPAKKNTQPFYHFAFNIPENKIVSARNWLAERTKLATIPRRQREKGMPNEVLSLGYWNAHSIYFWDPAGNILELICRHDMKNETKGEFRSDEIFYASEIGFVTDDVNQMAGQVKTTFQLEQYRSGDSSFRAIGDETGLLILFRRGGTPIGAQKGQSWQIHPTDVTIAPEIKFESKKLPHSIKTG